MEKTKLVQVIVDALENEGFEARSYSGRAMYGAQCLGVDCDSPIKVIAAIFRSVAVQDVDMIEEVADALEGGKTDSMGRDAILYFPGIAYDEGSADDDAEVR